MREFIYQDGPPRERAFQTEKCLTIEQSNDLRAAIEQVAFGEVKERGSFSEPKKSKKSKKG